MNLLLLAPHPFYQERGTPIAVNLLLASLARRGHRVDVLTYHEGAEVAHPGVAIHRIAAPPLVRGVPPGPSWKKIVCDVWLHRAALRLARAKRYDLVHAVEESAFTALALRRRFGLPYLYDMDSSLPRQIAEKFPAARAVLGPLRALERRALRGAAGVVVMCDDLADLARREGAAKVFVLRDVSLLADAPDPDPLRAELGIRGPCFLYVGNLERYQGADLMLESFSRAAAALPDAHLVVAGGKPADVARYRARAAALGPAGRVHFLGPQPLARLGSLLAAADVLVSPRTQGTNTPMKIYSYLHAGRAILATDLPTHTQVLDATVARLVPPQADAMAAALAELAANPALRAQLGAAARQRAEERHSPASFARAADELWEWAEREVARVF
jgi:glycosyltransferase involved in cell wall biosynthesis